MRGRWLVIGCESASYRLLVRVCRCLLSSVCVCGPARPLCTCASPRVVPFWLIDIHILSRLSFCWPRVSCFFQYGSPGQNFGIHTVNTSARPEIHEQRRCGGSVPPQLHAGLPVADVRPWAFQTDGDFHFSLSWQDETGHQWFVHQPFFVYQHPNGCAHRDTSDQLVVFKKFALHGRVRVHELGEHQLLANVFPRRETQWYSCETSPYGIVDAGVSPLSGPTKDLKSTGTSLSLWTPVLSGQEFYWRCRLRTR